MKLTKSQLKPICNQLGYYAENQLLDIDIPLPIESDCNSVFQASFKRMVCYHVGSIWSYSTGTSLKLEGYASNRNTTKDTFFKDLEKITQKKLLDFHWLSNPLGFPDFIQVPEPLECKIYRFQYLQFNNWHDSSVHVLPNGLIKWSGGSDNGEFEYNKDGFWNCFISFYKVESVKWVDHCPALGDWPGNS